MSETSSSQAQQTSRDSKKRRLAVVRVCAILLVGPVIVLGVNCYRYLTRPLFSSDQFGSSGAAVFWAWASTVQFNERQILAYDQRINMAVIIDADRRETGFNPIPEKRSMKYAAWRIDGRVIGVDAEPNTLVMVASDGTVNRERLPAGFVASAVEKRPPGEIPFFDDYRRVFLPATTTDPVENSIGGPPVLETTGN